MRAKPMLFIPVFLGLLLTSPPLEKPLQRARKAVETYQKMLKRELMDALAKGGPVNAIKVCQKKAPELARQFQKREGIKMRRVSARVRNPENKPKDWELQVLKRFEKSMAEGADPKTLEWYTAKGETFYYMKAIPIEGLCLTCHGQTLKPEVAQTLKKLYPEDQAVGFTKGDLRGAFSVALPLP